jgi:small subunit ribosomal protein S6
VTPASSATRAGITSPEGTTGGSPPILGQRVTTTANPTKPHSLATFSHRTRMPVRASGRRQFAPLLVSSPLPMAAGKPLYDLVLMLDSSAEDARRAEILKNVEDAVGKGGEVVNKQEWGARAMAYEIGHKKDAEYHLLQFHGTPDLLSQLDRTLRITDEVVRFRVIKLAPGTPPPPDQRAEPRPGGASEETAASEEPAASEPAYEPAPAGAFGEDD